MRPPPSAKTSSRQTPGADPGRAARRSGRLFLAWQIGIITPDDYQPTFTFYAYLILILGGTTRIWAIPVGALLFGLLYSGTRFLNFYPLSLFDSGIAPTCA